MKYVLSRRDPAGGRILLVESGSRSLIEGLLPHLKSTWAENYRIDLLTCYGGAPEGLPEGSRIYRVGDYPTKEKRAELVGELRASGYAYQGVICSAEPVMTKWKWMIAFRVPAKTFIINENGDYFWVHRDNRATLLRFAAVRLGLEGIGAVRTALRLAIFPFALVYLLLYAFNAHARRFVRRALHSQV